MKFFSIIFESLFLRKRKFVLHTAQRFSKCLPIPRFIKFAISKVIEQRGIIPRSSRIKYYRIFETGYNLNEKKVNHDLCRLFAAAMSGLTLIELIMTIIVAAIVLLPTSQVVVESLRHTQLPEHFAIASCLLEREIDRVSNLRFSAVVNEGPTSYSGSFSNYSYQVSYYYVNPGSLNTSVPGPTDYQRVTVTISSSGFPDVSAVAIVTNN